MRAIVLALALVSTIAYAQSTKFKAQTVIEARGVWLMADVDANRHQGTGELTLKLPSGKTDIYRTRCVGIRHKNIYDQGGNELEPQSSGTCRLIRNGNIVGTLTYNGAVRTISIEDMLCTVPHSEYFANVDWGYPAEGEPGVAGDSYDIKDEEGYVGGMYHHTIKFSTTCTDESA